MKATDHQVALAFVAGIILTLAIIRLLVAVVRYRRSCITAAQRKWRAEAEAKFPELAGEYPDDEWERLHAPQFRSAATQPAGRGDG